MKSRCQKKKGRDNINYAGRGITVCKEWISSFWEFYEDMGDRPDGKTLDRVDNNKGYSIDNCRWATPSEQMSNTRQNVIITYKDETLNIIDWSKRTGIPKQTLTRRYALGWPLDEVFLVGRSKIKRKTVRGMLAS
jgi:hypothetical protein